MIIDTFVYFTSLPISLFLEWLSLNIFLDINLLEKKFKPGDK